MPRSISLHPKARLVAVASAQSFHPHSCVSSHPFDPSAAAIPITPNAIRIYEELPVVFGKIGPAAIQALTDVATNEEQQESIRSTAVRGLARVAHYHPDSRDRIVVFLTEMMTNAVEDQWEFNTSLLVELVGLRATQAAEPIERAFAGNRLDVGMIGDWEDVRQDLGVQGLGLEMPECPHNSVEESGRQMGLGIFSHQPLMLDGEIDYDAELAYYERADETFSQSSEAQQVVERHGDLGWFRSLLEFGVNYLDEIVDEMTVSSVSDFVLDYVPRKVSINADAAASVVFELQKFWQYLDRVHELPEAKSIVEWLQTDGLVARLKGELSNPSNFGMAKSFFMAGTDAGYDMTSEEGLAEFMSAYNQSVASKQSPARSPSAPIVRGPRIGRNDPCPCGSGKKYKKCCGGSSNRGPSN